MAHGILHDDAGVTINPMPVSETETIRRDARNMQPSIRRESTTGPVSHACPGTGPTIYAPEPETVMPKFVGNACPKCGIRTPAIYCAEHAAKVERDTYQRELRQAEDLLQMVVDGGGEVDDDTLGDIKVFLGLQRPEERP